MYVCTYIYRTRKKGNISDSLKHMERVLNCQYIFSDEITCDSTLHEQGAFM